MDNLNVIDHIKELCRQRGWTYYKLAKVSGIPHSSLNTMLNKQHTPSMNNLIKICGGFDITLAEFFSSMEQPSNEQQELVNLWNGLVRPAKDLVMAYMYGLAQKDLSKRTMHND